MSEGIRTRRTAARVPGFKTPADDPPVEVPMEKPVPRPRPAVGRTPTGSARRSRQVTIRLPEQVFEQHRTRIREMAHDGFDTSFSEYVAALLHHSEHTTHQIGEFVRTMRRDLI